jgi:hypothetical protein
MRDRLKYGQVFPRFAGLCVFTLFCSLESLANWKDSKANSMPYNQNLPAPAIAF